MSKPKVIAFYPGEQDLFTGEIEIRSHEDEDGIVHDVEVSGAPSKHLSITSKVEKPLRTRHEADFTRLGGAPLVVCNVDLELDPQPTIEEIARTVLAVEI